MREGRGERECQGDLVARERRGELSSGDRLALGAHLESCDSCRMTREIRADFEDETAVEIDDGLRIARLSASARRWSQRRARPRGRGARRDNRWRRRLALGVVPLLLLAGSASATVWWWRSDTRAATARVALAPRPVTARTRPASLPARRAAPPVVAEASVPEAPAAVSQVSHPRPRARVVAALAPRESAASLLRLADEARRNGETDGALMFYRRLQVEFPETREAALSTVPLGGLLLRQGQAARSVEQFDRYLGAEPHGNLIPEALYGRGRALAAIGQREAERQTWRRLLQQAPGSAYEAHARRRLSELQ
jgi:tetratricopeptide (TPR) repeat protein